MSSTRYFDIAVLLLLAALPAMAQTGALTLSAPSSKLLVNGQMQLSASITTLAGTPIDNSALSWSSSDVSVATVSPVGMVRGTFPGDISVTARDAKTGASAALLLHVIPSSLTMRAPALQLHVGESLQASAAALDAVGDNIPGVTFQFRSGQPAIASIDADGLVTGIAEGFTTLEARIPAISSNAALIATLQIHVLPPLFYKLKKLISTDAPGPTTIAAYSSVNAVVSSQIGSIVTLANGGQAAILIEGGKPRPLAVVGQVLPNIGRMVVRIDAISTNSKGDVALLIEYPSQFCAATAVVIPHGQPEQEIGVANCNNGMYPRSLAEDGSVLYRYNDQVLLGSLSDPPKLLFSLATQPVAKDPVRSVNDFAPSRAGTFILNTTLVSGIHAYLHYDGKSLTQVYQDGDRIQNVTTTNMDLPVGGPDGAFYSRINAPNVVMLARIAPGPVKALVSNGDGVPNGTVGWVHSVVDASAAGVLVMADFNANPYQTGIAVWDGKAFTEITRADGYAAMISGSILSSGTVLASAGIFDFSIPGLRSIAGNGSQTMLLATGVPFPQPAPPGVDWHLASRGGGSTAIPFRGAGDAIVNVGATLQPLVTLGGQLPNKQVATSIGAAIGNQSGDLLFTAGYPTGTALFRYRSGKLETLIDAAVAGAGPGGVPLSYVNNYRARYLAMNNRGDAVATGSYNSNAYFGLVMFGSDGPHLIAQLNAPAPGGGNYTNFQNSLSIDDGGRVMFVANTSDGRVAAYFWDGKAVKRVIGIGEIGPANLAVNEISNIAGSGSGFLIVLAFGGYQIRELRYYDGLDMRTLASTDGSLFDGTSVSYFWSNECTLAANGDAHCLAATQDGGTGVYAHRTDGRDLIVARTRDQLPGGEWLIMPLSVSSSMNGEVYFTAHVWLNGIESLALFQAVPQ